MREMWAEDEGSEVVSYVLVQFLVLTVFLALLQFAVFVHTRNTAISAASEGARRYAMIGGAPSHAHEQVHQVMSALLGDSHVRDMSVTREARSGDGYEVAVVHLTTTYPLFLTMGPAWLEVRGTAVIEESLP